MAAGMPWLPLRCALGRAPVRVVLWFGAAILVCLLYDPATLGFMGDNRGQFYMAERVASGVPVHASSISAKTSLSFLLSGGAIRLGRLVGLPDFASGRILSIGAVSACVALAWLVCRRRGRSVWAADVAALTVLSLSAFMYTGVMGFRPKVFLVLFLFLTILAFARDRPFATGACAALAFLCWQPAILMFVFAAALFAVERDRARRIPAVRGLWACVTGALAVGALYEGYFLYHGLLRVQLDQELVFPLRFLPAHSEPIAANLLNIVESYHHGFGIYNPAWIVLLIWMARYWVAVARGRRIPFREGREGTVELYLQVCAFGGVLFSLREFQGSADLFLCIPFFAMAMADTADSVASSLSARRGAGAPRILRMGVVAGLAALVLLGPTRPVERTGVLKAWRETVGKPREHGHRVRRRRLVRYAVYGAIEPAEPQRLEDQLVLAHRVRTLARSEDGVTAIGCTHLLALNRMDNWSRYGHIFRGVAEYVEHELGRSPDFLSKGGRLPGIVLIDEKSLTRAPPALRARLEESYEDATTDPFHAQSIRLFRRRAQNGKNGLSQSRKGGNGDSQA